MSTDVLNELAQVISDHDPGHPLRVALDGVDGAGKTVLADSLVTPIPTYKRKFKAQILRVQFRVDGERSLARRGPVRVIAEAARLVILRPRRLRG